MKFLLDHDVPDDLSYLLEELAHEVTLLRKVLPEDASDESVLQFAHDNDCVLALTSALAAFGRLARRAIDSCDEMGDRDTADIFTEISRGVDKWLWMVEAHIQTER